MFVCIKQINYVIAGIKLFEDFFFFLINGLGAK